MKSKQLSRALYLSFPSPPTTPFVLLVHQGCVDKSVCDLSSRLLVFKFGVQISRPTEIIIFMTDVIACATT